MQAARGAALTEPAAEPPTEPSAEPGGHPGGAPRPTLLLALVAVVVLALDVATKVWVVAELEGRRSIELLGGELMLQVSRNPGAAFSFAPSATLLFTAVAVVVIVVIVRISPRLRSVGWALSLGLLLGGAAGNLVDRVFRDPGPGRGAVVDFIALGWFPSFNVADSGIVVGGLLAVLLTFRGIEVDGTRRPADHA